MPNRPMLDPRMQEAIEQVTAAHEELEIAIAWADRDYNDQVPVVFGRNLRQLEKLLAHALKNMVPARPDTLPAIMADYRLSVNNDRRTADAEQLALNVPMQSRPAFANKAGAR